MIIYVKLSSVSPFLFTDSPVTRFISSDIPFQHPFVCQSVDLSGKKWAITELGQGGPLRMANRGFWNPCIDSSDEEDPLRMGDTKKKMKCKVMLKKTKTNADAIKNPADILSDQDEDTEEDVKPSQTRRGKRIASDDDEEEPEVIEDDDVISSPPSSPRKRKKSSRTKKEKVKRKKKKGQSESDDDFDPGSDSLESGSGSEDEEEDLPTDDNISDSDFTPGLCRFNIQRPS